ncbi:MAG: nitronate monooxygenase [Deltaproteobacteria bacterium]|nr:nitronate monooxygenase [Deltaproteobacteria bacterium]
MGIHTELCDLLEIKHPVVLAGMGMGISGADLTAAVSEAGGLGLLGCSRLNPDQIRDLINKTRELTDKPFGVDILAPPLGAPGDRDELREQIPKEYWDFVEKVKRDLNIPDFDSPEYALTEEFMRRQMEVVVAEKVPVFATGLGTPAWVLEEIRAHGIKYISLVGKVKHALRLKDNRPDAIVAQGTEAGGHTGKIGSLPLIPMVVDAVSPIPVVAAGGISDGRGLAAALALGAGGVWMGTAFLATREAFHDTVRFGWMTPGDRAFYQETILKAAEDDAVVSRVKTGKTCRVYRGGLLKLWAESGLEPLPYQLQTVIMSDLETALMKADKCEYVLHVGGQVAGMIKELKSAGDLVREVVDQAAGIIKDRLPACVS